MSQRHDRRRVLKTLGGSLAAASSVPLFASDHERQRTSITTSLPLISESAAALDQLHALVIVHKGEVVLDQAYRGDATTQPVNVKSVSKTLVATLTGIALFNKYFDSIDQTLAELAPELIPARADPRVESITVRHLLSMQAGLQRTSGAGYGAWVSSADWVEYALSRPFVSEPGERMLYSTGSYHVLGALLTHLTGKSLLALAREWLGAPLGIHFPAWTRDPQGFYMGGNEMSLSPHSLAIFGELFRKRGFHNGNRLINGEWITAAWTPLTRSPYSGHAYGLGWFLARVGDHELAYARGYGGQLLYVVPSLELTVVITSNIHRPARSGGYMDSLHSLLSQQIIPVFS